MTQLAIKGHPTRGEEVIEILEMMGYFNFHDYTADTDSLCFYGCEITNRVYYDWVNSCEDMLIFTLEDFLEKFPYKVGDKVRTIYGKIGIISKPIWSNRDECIRYELEADTDSFYFVNELQPYKEETMDKVNKEIFDTHAQCCDISNRLIKEETMEDKGTLVQIDLTRELHIADEVEVILGDYEFVLKDSKTYFVKKKPQYPNTYVACCEILYHNENFQTVAQTIKGHLGKKLFALQKLLVCRNAYWKIAGEQMGLGKPWEPNWDDQEKATIKYCICISGNVISKDKFYLTNFILSFPTEEMRDAFYENFNVLIEICKELL